MSAPTPTQRALLVFREARDAEASIALLRLAPELRQRGWTLDGVFADGGALVPGVCRGLASMAVLERPRAVELAGGQRPSEAFRTLRAVAPYVRDFLRILRQRNPHVIHCNTSASLPEALIARAIGFAVVIAVPGAPAGTVAPVVEAAAVERAYHVALHARFAPRFTSKSNADG
jgi:hypothetical protein